MDQRSGVQKFNQGSTSVGRFIDLSTDSCRQEHKHGPHLLPFALDNVMGDVVEQLDLTFHKVPELMFKLRHLSFNGDLYLFEV
jgi:hypothetical protein